MEIKTIGICQSKLIIDADHSLNDSKEIMVIIIGKARRMERDWVHAAPMIGPLENGSIFSLKLN